MFSHFTNRFTQLQVADNSSLVVSVRLPFDLVFMFVAAICQSMNLWEMTLAIGRHTSPPKPNTDITDGFYAIWTLFHIEKELSVCLPINPPPSCIIDDVKIVIAAIDDNTQAAIDALCASAYYAPWDAGSPQPDSPDIEDQVRRILEDIDEYGESLPY